MQRALWAAVAAVGLVACGGGRQQETEAGAPATQPTPGEAAPADAGVADAAAAAAPSEAYATIEPRSGSDVRGRATFRQEGDQVAVRVEASGLTPGKHGVHVHEVGDCSAPDASSAGGHFNPEGMPHGAPDAPERHAGDFGNMEVGEDGAGTLELTTDRLTVGPGDRSVVGRAIIVHTGEDDLTSQPTGDAGGRLGCGVIMAGPPPEGAATP